MFQKVARAELGCDEGDFSVYEIYLLWLLIQQQARRKVYGVLCTASGDQ